MIPKLIHQVWLGQKPLPEQFAAYGATWRDHHPEWSYRLWTEDDIPDDLRRPEPLERIRHPVERADVLRLEILWRHGGVYVDTDLECVGSMEPHIGDADFFTAYLKPPSMSRAHKRVNNAFIGSIPGHPLLEQAIEEARPQEWYGAFDKTASGSLFFDRLVRKRSDVLILPAELVYPFSEAEQQGAISIHHVARSWKPPEEFREATERAEKRLQKAHRSLEREIKAHEKTRERLEKTEAKLRDRSSRSRGWAGRFRFFNRAG